MQLRAVLLCLPYFTIHMLNELQIIHKETQHRSLQCTGSASTEADLRLWRAVRAAVLNEQADSPH